MRSKTEYSGNDDSRSQVANQQQEVPRDETPQRNDVASRRKDSKAAQVALLSTKHSRLLGGGRG
jgi:hypothetical protein